MPDWRKPIVTVPLPGDASPEAREETLSRYGPVRMLEAERATVRRAAFDGPPEPLLANTLGPTAQWLREIRNVAEILAREGMLDGGAGGQDDGAGGGVDAAGAGGGADGLDGEGAAAGAAAGEDPAAGGARAAGVAERLGGSGGAGAGAEGRG